MTPQCQIVSFWGCFCVTSACVFRVQLWHCTSTLITSLRLPTVFLSCTVYLPEFPNLCRASIATSLLRRSVRSCIVCTCACIAVHSVSCVFTHHGYSRILESVHHCDSESTADNVSIAVVHDKWLLDSYS